MGGSNEVPDLRSQIKLGRIFGIEIGLHYGWFLIALLIVFSLFSEFHTSNPQWGDGVILSLAVATAILFFVSLLLHELARSIVASSNGLPVKEITLFVGWRVSDREEPNERKTRVLYGVCRTTDQRCHRRDLPAGGTGYWRSVVRSMDGHAALARIYKSLAGCFQSDSGTSPRQFTIQGIAYCEWGTVKKDYWPNCKETCTWED